MRLLDDAGRNPAVVWWMTVDDLSGQVRDRWTAQLGPEEAGRASRLRREADRNAFVAAHMLLRVLLTACTGAPVSRWRFSDGPHGKPELHADHALPELQFSLSHSAGAVACGVARGHRIGVDIETHAKLPEVMEIADAHFAPEERALLLAAGAEGRLPMFYTLWTLKEAVLKATGRGLDMPLGDVIFTLSPIRLRFRGQDDAPSGWRFLNTTPTAGHTLSVACDRDAGLEIRRVTAAEIEAGIGR